MRLQRFFIAFSLLVLTPLMHTRPEKVVVVGGVFDVLHAGHFHFLEAAKQQGDFLVVLLEPDEKVKATKSTPELPRPFHDEQTRKYQVAHIKHVDMVIVLPCLKNYDDYLNFLQQSLPERYNLQPHAIAITSNDPIKRLKQKMADELGISLIAVIDRLEPYSTTKILEAKKRKFHDI